MIIHKYPDDRECFSFEEGDHVIMNTNESYGDYLNKGDEGYISLQYYDKSKGYSSINGSVIVTKKGELKGNGVSAPAWELDPMPETYKNASIVDVDYDGDPLTKCFMEKL